MKAIIFRFCLLLHLLFACNLEVSASSNGELDISKIVFEHLSDTYEWHIITVDGVHYSIPLPIILRSEQTGEWHCFSSSNLTNAMHEGKSDYLGFYYDQEHHGKIYERLLDGTSVRPLDLSITKNVVQIWIVVILLLVVFLTCARWYKKNDSKRVVPTGFVGSIEMLVMMINEDVIKSSVGEKHYRAYAPFLLTIFFFLLFTNVLGLLPIFPGGANVTGNINVTFCLAFFTMLAINLFGNKEYWKEVFWPDVPLFLKFPIPIMPVIEMMGLLIKPCALMIRLFANMMAGHAVILSFTCVIFLGWSISVCMGLGMTIFSFIMMVFMNCLEFLVAFIQAYVFTMLSSVFIGFAHPEHNSH